MIIAGMYFTYNKSCGNCGTGIQVYFDRNKAQYTYQSKLVCSDLVQDTIILTNPYQSQEEAYLHLEPVLEKFENYNAEIFYQDYDVYLSQLNNVENKETLRQELHGVYLALKERHNKDQFILNEIDKIFKNSMPDDYKIKRED